MERILTGLWLVAAGAAWCLGGEAPEMAPPVYRYLMVIESGTGMARQKDIALDTVHQLILGGFNGRIRQGEVLGIWPFGNEIDRTFCRPIHWRSAEARDLGNFIYRKLRDLEFAKKSRLEAALAGVNNEAQHSERLTVFLVISGSEPVQGTGFDEEINSVLRQHARGMAEAKRPFVTVLNYEGGKAIAQAVTPGGMKIYIPPMPEAVVTNAPQPEPVAATVDPEAEVTPSEPPPKPMTVSEIAEKLREAEVERQRLAAAEAASAPPDAAAPTPTPESVAPGETTLTEEKRLEPPAGPAGEVPAAEPRRTEAQVIEPPPAIPPVPEAVATSEPVPADASSPVVDQTVVPSEGEKPESEQVVLEPSDTQAGEPVMPEPAEPEGVVSESGQPPVAAVVLPERSTQERLFYLGTGLGLLLAAILLIWWRFHRPRRRAHASVISQSMNRR